MTKLPLSNWSGIDAKGKNWRRGGEYSIPNTTNFEHHYQMYLNIIQWIEEHVERPMRNAKWAKIGDCIYVQLRKEKDFAYFILRWGAGKG